MKGAHRKTEAVSVSLQGNRPVETDPKSPGRVFSFKAVTSNVDIQCTQTLTYVLCKYQNPLCILCSVKKRE